MSTWTSKGVVAWSDTDASGRYHFTAAYRWAENAEHELYRSIAPGIDAGRFPRRSASASYERPLVAGDEYVVELDAGEVGTTSITYSWRVLSPDGVAARGNHTVVHLGEDGRPAPVPDTIRSRLTGAEPRND